MQQISLPNGGSWSQAFHAQTAETGDENATLLAHDRIVLGRKLWQVSRLIRSSRIQRCRSFFRKGRSSSYILERQPGKLVLETFSWDNNVNWIDRGADKNRESMTSCGFCCYYLEHCSKTNHIAIKWTKYENVCGLIASHKIWWSLNFLRLSVTWVKLSRWRKK